MKKFNDIERYWNDPIITLFDVSKKEQIIYFECTIQHVSTQEIKEYKGHVSFKEYYIFFNDKSTNFNIKEINYLIKKGFYLKLETYKKQNKINYD